MVSTGNGESKHEVQEELEMGKTTNVKLRDYISVQVPTVDKGLLGQTHHEKRFLDFLKARPSKDWFRKFGFVGRVSAFSFLRRNANQSDGSVPTNPPPPGGRGRFRVPFVRKINWGSLIRYFKNWIKNPMNMALFVWLLFVAAGIILLGLLMFGILDSVIPDGPRKRWTEITNQIVNALFTIMCLYQHPRLCHHFALLCKWKPQDSAELRKLYCKNGVRRPHEKAHLLFVILLLHITCLSQYALCFLYWAYTSKTRSDFGVYLCMGVGIASPIIAGLYTVYSPLGKNYESETDEESQREAYIAAKLENSELKLYTRGVVVTSPEWVGGLFDCWDDLTVAYLSFFCTCCVFGWNMERLGFGNMYVHIFTFILICIAPFWVFSVSALNISDDTIKWMVAITGFVLCVFGLLYGGFWRIQMRKKFKLPGNPFCCGFPVVTDCMQWLFCCSCSLSQEVRTANFYDIEEDSFNRNETEESSRPALHPLPREGESGPVIKSIVDSSIPNQSSPAITGVTNPPSSTQVELSIPMEGELPTSEMDHTMTPPLQPLIQ